MDPAKTNKSISDSLETTTRMLPYIPYLLQDLWALGSSVEFILQIIGGLELPRTAKVLDLGCGKGALSVQIASKFGLHTTGVDAMQPFLQDAIKKAEEYNVSNLCEFMNEDILEYTSNEHDYDIVILAALGEVFGSMKDTVCRLRIQVKDKGYMIIDDGYLRQAGYLIRRGYRNCKNHEETLYELVSSGDVLLKEISTDELSNEINEEYTALIKKRGEELIKLNPDLKEEINIYIRGQEEECKFLENEIGGAVWLLEKRGIYRSNS